MSRFGPRSCLRFAICLILSACIRQVPQPDSRACPPRSDGLVASNILRADYSGSQTCGACHQAIYNGFMQSPMHNMTRLADSAHIHAPFDGHVFRFKEDRVILESHGGKKWMRVESRKFGNHAFRVTKVIGGNHREDFAGVESGKKDTLTEFILPVSYMIETGLFRYKGYSVMETERPGLKVSAVWNGACIFCHNTEPYFSTMFGELSGPGATPYQGKWVDPSLPAARRWVLQITDTGAYRNALQDEIAFLKHRPPAHTAIPTKRFSLLALQTTRERFNQTHLVEVGIGCEACHGGSREHALNPLIKPSLEPRSPFLNVNMPPVDSTLTPQARKNALITRTCARCHQVLFTGYPWTWEGAGRDDPMPGGAHINSGEARDLLLSDCQVACTACHDPHAHADREKLARLEGPAGNEVCLACHGQLRPHAALQAHSHHSPTGPGGLCLNCHMPRKNMTLDSRLGRYHRIGSPNDPIRVERDRPLECALCHGDRSVGRLVDTMEAWWPRAFDSHGNNRGENHASKYDWHALDTLYGNKDANVLEATLRKGKPHEMAVALFLAGRSGNKALVPLVEKQLANPYPLVRYYADNALSALLESPSPLDLHQENEAIAKAAADWIESVAKPGGRQPP